MFGKGGYRVYKAELQTAEIGPLFRVLRKRVIFLLITSTAIYCQMNLHFGNFPHPSSCSRIVENCQNAKSLGKKLLWNWLNYRVLFSESLNFFMGLPWKIYHWLFVPDIYKYIGSPKIIIDQKPNEKFFTRNPNSKYQRILQSPWDSGTHHIRYGSNLKNLTLHFWKVAKMRHLGLHWKVFHGAFVPYLFPDIYIQGVFLLFRPENNYV